MSEMLTPNQIDLAHAPAFRLGPVSVEPALRQVTTTHSETLEPRVMQVLVVLAMANGRIVSRDDLVRACWEGRIVGDDSISRVIARLRKFAKEHGEDVLRIETITKVGYRLIGPVVYASASQNAPLPSATPAVAATPHIATPSPAAAISIVGPLLPAKPSIAILPLRNINVDPTRDYFADSLTEDLVTELSRWRWFFVISPYSSLRYRNTVNDLVQIGSELGVRYLLDGSVGVTGDQLRIRVRLVDTVDQTTLWAEKYDRNIGEILALQDEITQQIAASIAPAMLDSVRGRAARKPLHDISALDCCYRGMWQMNQISSISQEQALSLFREAVARDPGLSIGYIGLSRALYARAIYGASPEPAADFAAALGAAQRAIEIDPYDAGGYFAAAGAELYLGDHVAALRDARRSVDLNPNFGYAHYRLGQVYIFCGQPREALTPISQAIRLSPYDPQMRVILETLALAYYHMQDYKIAAETAQKASLAPGGGSAVLAASLARLGQMQDAAGAVARMPKQLSSLYRPAAAPYSAATDRDHIRDGFRLAVAASDQRN